MVQKLEDKGLVVRVSDGKDRKKIYIELSEKALAYYRKLKEQTDFFFSKLVEKIGERQMENFIKVAKIFLEALKDVKCEYNEKNDDKSINHAINFTLQKTNRQTTVPLYNILNKTFKSPFTIIDADYEISKIFDMFDSDLMSSDVLKNATLSFKFHEFILFLIKNAYKNELVPHALKNSDTNMSRAYKINMMVNACYAENITAKSTAEHLKISTRQLSRIMLSNFGCSFKELLTHARMSQAIILLKTTDKTISQISTEVGYNSTKLFYSAFKKYYGCLPSEIKADASKSLPSLPKKIPSDIGIN